MKTWNEREARLAYDLLNRGASEQEFMDALGTTRNSAKLRLRNSKKLKTMITNQKQALKASPPKSRDRERRRLKVLEVVERLRKEHRAA